MSFDIQAEPRADAGRTQSRRLRRAGRVPAVVYGAGKSTDSVSLDHNALTHQMAIEAFYTSVLTLKIGKESHSVIVKDVQRHPASPQILHLDFQRVVEDQALTLNVPIRFIGEDVAVGVKEQGGVVEPLLTDVEISCLPRHLPEFLELDVSELGLNELYHLSDIKFPEGVTSVALAHEQDLPVVAINPPRREEVDEVEVEVDAEAAAEADAEAAADGDAPAADAGGGAPDAEGSGDKDKD